MVKDNYLKGIVGTGITNLVGVGMMGATATEINALPAGGGKTVAGMIPGFQAISLVGANLKSVGSFGTSSKSSKSTKKSKW